MLCRHIDLDYDDVEEDQEGIMADQRYQQGRSQKSRRRAQLNPIDEECLEVIRKKRQKEVEMW